MGRASVAFFILCLSMSPINAEWVHGPIDTLTSNDVWDETGTQSLAIDSSDCLHLVWRQEIPGGGWRILYMTKPSEQPWTTPVEIPPIVTNNRVPALAVEPAGFVHIVWDGFSGGDYDIFYATNKTMIWETIALTDNLHADGAPTIATDTAGSVHIAWVGYDTVSSQNKIFYATDACGDWDIQLVEESSGGASNPHIGVAAVGIAHIAYQTVSGDTGQIHHLENYSLADTNWTDETIETANVSDRYSFIVAEEDGTLHLIVSGDLGYWGAPYNHYYFYRPSGSNVWSPSELCSEEDQGGFDPILTIDTAGTPHSVWARLSGNIYFGELSYSSKVVNDNWNIQPLLGGAPDYLENPSLIIDQFNFGHLVCYELYELHEVLYAKTSESLAPARSFVRGDANADQFITISDGLYIFKHLFLPGTPTPSCVDALDVTDNGNITMQDGIYLLQHLFIPGSPEPPPPFPECGYDPTWEGLGCSESTCEVQ